MNKIYVPAVALAIASILFPSCSKTEGNGGDEASLIHHITLTAGTAENDSDNLSDGNSDKANGIETKATFAADVTSNTPFYWQKDDKVGVFASGAEGIYPLTVKERTTDYKNATFEGNIKGTLGEYAVYPYNENHKISGNTLTYHLPSEYNLSYIAQDYCTSSALSDLDSFNAGNAAPALLAKISDDGSNAEFKHLGGVLCIKVEGIKSSTVELTITADRQICGDFTVNLATENPQIETSSEATADPDVASDNNTVKISGIVADLATGTGVFYIPMPAGEYNLRIKFGYSNNPTYGELFYVSSVKSLKMSRCNIKRASCNKNALTKDGYMLVNGYKYVDLGLQSGNLWATTNVGATLPADYGNYYAYADAAAAAQGCTKKCKIPSEGEFQDLINHTTLEYTSGEKNSSDKYTAGAYFKSKSNSNYIFFPFSGWSASGSGSQQTGRESISWSTTKYNDQQMKCLHVAINTQIEADFTHFLPNMLLPVRTLITPDSI